MNGYNLVSSIILEKSVSKAQQKFFGMVHAVQKYGMPAPSKAIAKVAKNMGSKEVKKFAETKTKGLPEKVKN